MNPAEERMIEIGLEERLGRVKVPTWRAGMHGKRSRWGGRLSWLGLGAAAAVLLAVFYPRPVTTNSDHGVVAMGPEHTMPVPVNEICVLTIKCKSPVGGSEEECFGDYDYTILHELVAGSDLIVVGNVKAADKHTAAFAVDQILKGNLPTADQSLAIDANTAVPVEACMGPLTWTVGETACLFLQSDGSDYTVRFAGAGKQSLPLKGYLDEAALREYIGRGTLPLAKLVARFGPTVLTKATYDLGSWNLAQNKSPYGPEVLKLVQAPAVQAALLKYIVNDLRSWEQAKDPKKFNAAVQAALYATPTTLVSETDLGGWDAIHDRLDEWFTAMRKMEKEDPKELGGLISLDELTLAEKKIAAAVDAKARQLREKEKSTIDQELIDVE